ncbi:PREDICTED: selenoprotein H [Fragaria vesca subsp. vesca]|uniref:selenoprotein H n=1 Tax=Fragaria vesca subsp. vesca TaxID=101020 RepID=UPI0002C36D48|nr:PREDICTED: selenoprotein H [Fragaria vesca subsp. vesca]
MAPKKRKADEEPEPAKSPVESTRMVTRGSEAAARRQTRSSTQGGDAKSVKPVPKKPAAARKKSKKKKEEAKSEQGEEAESDEEVDKVEDEEVNTKTIVIERCTQCNSFKTRADQVRASLESLPGITVKINPVKPRRGCFEIREEGGEKFISLLDMKRPFKPMKDLNMQEVIDNIIQKIQ